MADVGVENAGDVVFDVESQSREGYQGFVEDIIKEFGILNNNVILNDNVKLWTLPKVHDSFVFVKKMVGNLADGDSPVYLVFKQRDVYYIAWGIDDADADEDAKEEDKKKWFILKEASSSFKKFEKEKKGKNFLKIGEEGKRIKRSTKKGKGGESHSSASTPVSEYLVKQLANAKVMNIETNYCRIAAAAGPREDIALGKYALRNALVILSQAGDEDLNDAYFAKSCMTVMQMIPEPARYKPLLDFIYEHYYYGKCAEYKLVKKQNDWSTKSENLYNLLKVTADFTPEQLKLLSEGWTLIQEP